MKILTPGIFATLILSSVFVAVSARSQEPATNCKTDQTQMAMNYCANQSFKAADAELNTVYRQVRNNYKGTAQESQLVDAQLAWIKFRDADCRFSADRFKGGSIAPLIYSSCQEGLTRQRIRSLRDYSDSL
jgi:uncharacterized protein YecT (DUF1311 family)